MFLIETHLTDAHPLDTSWVDRALASTAADGGRGCLVGRPVDMGPGVLLTLRAEPAPGAFALTHRVDGPATGPARYLKLISFDGPRSEVWAAAEQRGSAERIGPAVRDCPGVVASLHARAEDNAVRVLLLAEDVDALEAATTLALSTPLLPGEDRALLTGPDRITVHRLLHVELPA